MHDPAKICIGMEFEHQDHDRNMSNDEWENINSYPFDQQRLQQQQQSLILHGCDGYKYIQPLSQSLHEEPSPLSMQPPSTMVSGYRRLLPATKPSPSLWPSMLANSTDFQPSTVIVPPIGSHMKTGKLPPPLTSSRRKMLTDDDRQRLCQFHKDNPSMKQIEIGAKFGIERSTVSKILCQKNKYILSKGQTLCLAKSSIRDPLYTNRALAQKPAKQGTLLNDNTIGKRAQKFAQSTHNNESQARVKNISWLEKSKQKNSVRARKLLRRTTDTNVSDSSSVYLESCGPSGACTPRSMSPNSQSTTLSPTAFIGSEPLPFSGDTTSPRLFKISPDTTCSPFLPSQLSGHPLSNTFQCSRSQNIPCFDPSYISPSQTCAGPLMPRHCQPPIAPPFALEESHQDNGFSIDSTISSHSLQDYGSTSSTANICRTPGLITTNIDSNINCISKNSSPLLVSIQSSCPSQEDAQKALQTLLSFFSNKFS